MSSIDEWEARSSYLLSPQRRSETSPAKHRGLAEVLERNIDAIEQHRHEMDGARSVQEQIADQITRFSGSMTFIYLHTLVFLVWILWNLPFTGLPAFDPYPFGMLTTIVSLEAIFLSTFVLLSQNRQATTDERRTELDLQINLLTEYEVTRILKLVDQLAGRNGLTSRYAGELKELEQDVEPADVLNELESRANQPHVG